MAISCFDIFFFDPENKKTLFLNGHKIIVFKI